PTTSARMTGACARAISRMAAAPSTRCARIIPCGASWRPGAWMAGRGWMRGSANCLLRLGWRRADAGAVQAGHLVLFEGAAGLLHHRAGDRYLASLAVDQRAGKALAQLLLLQLHQLFDAEWLVVRHGRLLGRGVAGDCKPVVEGFSKYRLTTGSASSVAAGWRSRWPARAEAGRYCCARRPSATAAGRRPAAHPATASPSAS